MPFDMCYPPQLQQGSGAAAETNVNKKTKNTAPELIPQNSTPGQTAQGTH